MSRGDQRERDRKRAEKRRKVAGGKAKDSDLSAAQRKERDAQIMREKQQAAEAKKNKK